MFSQLELVRLAQSIMCAVLTALLLQPTFTHCLGFDVRRRHGPLTIQVVSSHNNNKTYLGDNTQQ